MKKTLLIVLGICLLAGGIGYTHWWWTAIKQAGDLMTSADAQDFNEASPRYGRFAKALRIVGINPLADTRDGSAAAAAELAEKISRVFYAHTAAGAFAAFVGAIVTIVGVCQRASGRPLAQGS